MAGLRRGRLRHPSAVQKERTEKANSLPRTSSPLKSWKLFFKRRDGGTTSFRYVRRGTIEEARLRVKAVFDDDEEDVYDSAWIVEDIGT